MSDQELKPCPFCGQRPENEELINQGYDNPEWWIECKNEDCPVNPWVGDSCREVARERWNTRTPDPMLEELVGALEKLSVLGNEPLPGNSIGNVVAQQALKKYQQSKVQP